MSSSNCCFLTCIQVSQEADKAVWCSHYFKNFPQFVVIHTVKYFSVVNEAEVDFFWNSLTFSMIQWMLAISLNSVQGLHFFSISSLIPIFDLFIIGILTCVKWYLILCLLSLVFSVVEHLFMHLLGIYEFFGKISNQALCPFLNKFFLLSCVISRYILDINH